MLYVRQTATVLGLTICLTLFVGGASAYSVDKIATLASGTCPSWCDAEHEASHCKHGDCKECSFCTDDVGPCAKWCAADVHVGHCDHDDCKGCDDCTPVQRLPTFGSSGPSLGSSLGSSHSCSYNCPASSPCTEHGQCASGVCARHESTSSRYDNVPHYYCCPGPNDYYHTGYIGSSHIEFCTALSGGTRCQHDKQCSSYCGLLAPCTEEAFGKGACKSDTTYVCNCKPDEQEFCNDPASRNCLKVSPKPEGKWEIIHDVSGAGPNGQTVTMTKGTTTTHSVQKTSTFTSSLSDEVSAGFKIDAVTDESEKLTVSMSSSISSSFSDSISQTHTESFSASFGNGLVWQWKFHFETGCGTVTTNTETLAHTANADNPPCCLPHHFIAQETKVWGYSPTTCSSGPNLCVK